MRPSPSWCNRARRIRAVRVERLGDTLRTVTARLRETVAQAVSTHLASALREAVLALVPDSKPSWALPRSPEPSPYRPQSPWGEPDRDDRDEDDSDLPAADWSHEPSRGWREVACQPPLPTPSTGEPPHRVRWHGALAVGCQAAAWWLRRQVSRASAMVAVGIGAFATGAAFVAGIGLAESALQLLRLADALRSGTQALASWS